MSITVGTKLFVVEKTYRRSDTARKGYEEVTRVGRKYFYIGDGYRERKFCMDTLREVNEINFQDQAYLTEADYERAVRTSMVIGEIESRVRGWGWHKDVPLDKLEVILTILREHE